MASDQYAQVIHNLTYHPVRDHRQGQMEEIRQAFKEVAKLVDVTIPDGREKAMCFTDIENACQNAIAAVARHGLNPNHFPEDGR